MRHIVLLMLIGPVLLAPGAAVSQALPDPSDKEAVTRTVNLFADCSGVYELAARIAESATDPHPALATLARDHARGAMLAAELLLSQEAKANGKLRSPGAFASYVEARSATKLAQLAAIFEAHDMKTLETEQQSCIAVSELQAKILQLFRDGMADRP